MKHAERILLALLLSVGAQPALSYETQTHALITAEAYDRSVLSQTGEGSVVSRLLLDRVLPSNPFKPYWTPVQPTMYFSDHTGDLPSFDRPAAFERCQMRQFLTLPLDREKFQNLFVDTVEYDGQPPLLNIRNWLVRGAIREDDMGNSPPGLLGLRGSQCALQWLGTVGQQPGRILRPLNHFYDNVHHTGLVTDPLIEGLKSVDWALGYQNSFAVPAQPAVGGARNTYSYLDARNAFWQALTYRSPLEEGDSDDSLHRSNDSKTRLIYWATLFRSLGNVVHLLEDAAQPQHTRNDPHSAINTQEQQAFEAYTNARILGSGDVGQFVRGFFSSKRVPLSVPKLGTYRVDASRHVRLAAQLFTKRGLDGHYLDIPFFGRD